MAFKIQNPFKKIFLLFTVTVMLFSASLTWAKNLMPTQQLIHDLEQMKTYSAAFSQTAYNKQNQITQRATGKVAWQKPDLFLWRIQSDPKQTVLLKKKALWIYDPDLEQLTIRTWKPVQDQVAPVLLLNAPEKTIAKNFEVTVSALNKNKMRFNLISKNRDALFYLIQLEFDQGKLVQMNLHDALSGVTQIQFTKIQLNQSISDQVFELKYPASTEIMDERKIKK